ncbi:MAG TPA: hypothetical protein VFV08_11460, partial [Puia sp.]|nr:hypothetical protein [Puia sp.]
EHPISVKMENLSEALQQANSSTTQPSLSSPSAEIVAEIPSTTLSTTATTDPTINSPTIQSTTTAVGEKNNLALLSATPRYNDSLIDTHNRTPLANSLSGEKNLIISRLPATPSSIKSALLDYITSNYKTLKITNSARVGAYVDYMIDSSAHARAPNGFANFYPAAKQDPNIASLLDALQQIRSKSRRSTKTYKNIKGSGKFLQRTALNKQQQQQNLRFRPQLW